MTVALLIAVATRASLLTVTALVALALAFRDLILLGVAPFGTLMRLPPIMSRYFPGAVGPALGLLSLGILLLVAAVIVAAVATIVLVAGLG